MHHNEGTGYDQGFLDRYERENLSLDDHTLKVGFANDGVFSWGEMETAYGPSKAFSVANEFGIVDGLCFSTTVNGFKSIASIALGEGESPSHVDYKGVLRRMDIATLYTSREILVWTCLTKLQRSSSKSPMARALSK